MIKNKNFILQIVIVLISTFSSCSSSTNADKISRIKINQTYYDSFYNERFSVDIYDDSVKENVAFVNKVLNARTITDPMIKEALLNGEFIIEFFENKDLVLKYNVSNSFNAFDMLGNYNHRCKKLKIAEQIPGMIDIESWYLKDEPRIREDLYKGKNEKVLISLFGNDYSIFRSFIYEENMEFISEIEPDYSKCLKNTDYGKKIKILKWKRKDKNIYAWFIEEDERWICFSSFEFGGNITF
ncbi:MAG: hypothetical protein J6Y30_04050 [Treponema sp.]|nr:hypothetical protein [Treponema sp.]